MRKLAEQKQKRSELELAVETSATPETMRGKARELFRWASYRWSRKLRHKSGGRYICMYPDKVRPFSGGAGS